MMQNDSNRPSRGAAWKRFRSAPYKATWLLCVTLLPGCSQFTAAPPEMTYSKAVSRELYQMEPWSLEGRVALTGGQDSWTADLAWVHQRDDERIKLSGPLGQGAVMIHLAGNVVTVAQGDGKIQSSNDPEGFIDQQLGVFVPVTSLRYWVLGLPEPNRDVEEAGNGFRQSGWTVAFQAMQTVGQWLLPRKMSVTNDRVKLKLIIDQWNLNGGNAK